MKPAWHFETSVLHETYQTVLPSLQVYLEVRFVLLLFASVFCGILFL